MAASSNAESSTDSSVVVGALAGAFAGAMTRFVTAPLDIVKIRLQLQVAKDARYRGAFDAARAIVAREGIHALWRGNVPAEFMYLIYCGTQFCVWEATTRAKKHLNVQNSLGIDFCGGALAGAAATATAYPFDLLRTRYAMHGTTKVYTSLIGAFQYIWTHEGRNGIYKGLTASLIQIIPYMGLVLMSYRAIQSGLGVDPQNPSQASTAFAGFASGLFSKSVVYPLDTIRRRLQVQSPVRSQYVVTGIPTYINIGNCIRQICRQEGLGGFYKGLTPALIKAAPSSALTLFFYELSRKIIRKSISYSNPNR